MNRLLTIASIWLVDDNGILTPIVVTGIVGYLVFVLSVVSEWNRRIESIKYRRVFAQRNGTRDTILVDDK